jgi:hypothetical protein
VFEFREVKAILIPEIRFIQDIDKLTIFKEMELLDESFRRGESVYF